MLSQENVAFLETIALKGGAPLLARLHAHLDRAEAAPSYLKALNTTLNKERKAFNKTGETTTSVEGIVPPVDAIFYTDIKPPKVFTQNRIVYIEGVTVNTSSFTEEELALFWWQPLTEPRLIEVLQPVAKMLENWNQFKFTWQLGSYAAQQVVEPSPDIHPAIVAAGLQDVYKHQSEQ